MEQNKQKFKHQFTLKLAFSTTILPTTLKLLSLYNKIRNIYQKYISIYFCFFIFKLLIFSAHEYKEEKIFIFTYLTILMWISNMALLLLLSICTDKNLFLSCSCYVFSHTLHLDFFNIQFILQSWLILMLNLSSRLIAWSLISVRIRWRRESTQG